MTVSSLPADLAEFVQHEIAAGHYNSAEELICDSLRLMQSQREQLHELRDELQPALDELDRGGGIVVKSEDLRKFFDEIAAEVKLELGHQKPSCK